ncbi:hypothetical protein NRY68_05870 [Acidithiobacillus ferrooxidans]|uniref:hypothetical protein n=1 Tax=Acidithiobacillus ferrooxidans TaxID=920 RepID=UPI0021495ABD|nr:hypothetical protein [Acidithiobacillus ferrooxidans]MCR1345334.1 hypothetical protein [Acidithiobacillus ferrooxidans]MCR1354494.1 hypothetical protein [Acidithiobacillus ferrooxidans]MDA8378395.1 hypothetical protein [Planctomycetia bacterium]
MKIKVCVGCDVASYANVEMDVPEFNLEHVKRKMNALIDNGDLQFEAEDPNGSDYQSGHRIVYAKNIETDEDLCDFVPLNPAYYELGQDTMHTLRLHLEGKMDVDSLVEELVRLAHEHNTYPVDLRNKAITSAIVKTEAQSPEWAF